jgi:hypothetical protein
MLRYIDTQEPWDGERINGIAYPRSIETKWTTQELADIGLEVAPPPPPRELPPPSSIHKATIVRRMTSEEVAAMLAALDAHPDPKMAELYRATPTFNHNAPEWPVMEAAFVAVLGEERAAEVLEPEF